jgi:hypothetical protein
LLAEYVGTRDLKLKDPPIGAQQYVLTPFRIDENVLNSAKPRNEDNSAVSGAGSFGDDRKDLLPFRQHPDLMRLQCR